jgi:two-component system chemotaxis response regulator CheB
MDAYSDAETLVPDLAIVSIEFSELDEFEMLRALFSALDIRWLFATSENCSNRSASHSGPKGADIFPVNTNDPPENLRHQLNTILNVPKRTYSKNAIQTSNFGLDQCLVIIGSSTGGVEALGQLLSSYPKDCPPTLIVQHTGASFGESLVRLLNNSCEAEVVCARNGQSVAKGIVCVAAGQRAHMEIRPRPPLSVRLKEGEPVSGHIPSVDAMFASAMPFAKKTVACLLTGMGSDGAEGLLRLRKAGARTFAQDKNSCVVYGMPRVAWEIGAAEKQVPLRDMCRTILQTCREIASPQHHAENRSNREIRNSSTR